MSLQRLLLTEHHVADGAGRFPAVHRLVADVGRITVVGTPTDRTSCSWQPSPPSCNFENGQVYDNLYITYPHGATIFKIIKQKQSHKSVKQCMATRAVLDSCVMSQMWLDSDPNESSQSWVGRENQGYESSQSRITLIVTRVRVESTGYCWSQSWVSGSSEQKTLVFCIYL